MQGPGGVAMCHRPPPEEAGPGPAPPTCPEPGSEGLSRPACWPHPGPALVPRAPWAGLSPTHPNPEVELKEPGGRTHTGHVASPSWALACGARPMLTRGARDRKRGFLS